MSALTRFEVADGKGGLLATAKTYKEAERLAKYHLPVFRYALIIDTMAHHGKPKRWKPNGEVMEVKP